MLAVSNTMVAEEMVQVNPHYVYSNVMHCMYVHMYIQYLSLRYICCDSVLNCTYLLKNCVYISVQYTPLPGQPPVFKFCNRDISGFKKLYTALAS